MLYVGVTNDLRRRMWEHTRKINDGFAAKYGICRLVYYEPFDFVQNAIAREKQLKRWRRDKKVNLIATTNPGWVDLSCEWEPLYRELDEALI